MPWQVIQLAAENIRLHEDSYSGSLAGTALTLVATNSSLVVAIPDVAAGLHELSVSVNGNTHRMPFTVVAAPAIPYPHAYVTTLLADIKTWALALVDDLDQFALDMPDLFGPGGFDALRADVIAQAAALQADIDAMTAGELADFARYLQANRSNLGISGPVGPLGVAKGRAGSAMGTRWRSLHPPTANHSSRVTP